MGTDNEVTLQVDVCYLCCSLTNVERSWAVAIEELLGHDVNVKDAEDGNQVANSDQVM